MRINFKNKVSIKLIILSLFLVFTAPLSLQADILNNEKTQDFQNNLNNIAGYTDYSTTQNLEDIIGNVIRVALSLLGTVFLMLMIIAGNNWMRAAGNEDKIKKAKNQVQSLVIGLIIVISAYALSFWISKIVATALIN